MIDWEKEGFQIIGQASNGQEAIEFINNTLPHIVITDVVMPKVDGVELIKFLQSNYPSIKIIVLSSYSDFDYVKSSFTYGAIDYILKPSLNIDELLNTLKKAASKLENFKLSTNNATLTEKNMLSRLLIGFESLDDLTYFNNIFTNDSFCLLGISTKGLGYDYKTKSALMNSLYHDLNEEKSKILLLKI